MSFIGDIAGALLGRSAANDATAAQRDAANAANMTQRYMYDTNRADNQPLLDTRNSALSQINALLANPSGITQQPDYQFGFDQGTRGVNAGAAARGMTYSGAAGKALTRFGQDYAGTKLNESYNRLSNLAGLGQVATNSNTAAGMNYANNVGNNLMGAANAQGAGALYNARNFGNALNSLGAYGDRNGWFSGGGSGGTGTPGGAVGVDPNYDWIG